MKFSPQDERRLAEDLACFTHDPLGYVMYAFPWGEGDLAGMKPDTWQADLLMEIGSTFDENPDAVLQLARASGHGIGKALCDDTILDTPGGKRRWGSLSAGDTVFGRDGRPTTILAIHPQGERQMYRVTFSDGSSTLADADHLWTVKGRRERRNGFDWSNLTTRQIMELGVKRSNGAAEARQFEIPGYQAVHYPHQAVPLDPYLLGCWLGDGTRSKGAITSEDPEIHAAFAEQFAPGRVDQAGNATTVCYRGLQSILRELGLLGHHPYVPDAYKYTDPSARLAVLQGLLDTDGWVEQSGTIAFGSVHPQLTQDVIWLARSMGLIARDTGAKDKWYTSGGERVQGQPFHTCSITWDGSTAVFGLMRKLDRLSNPQDRYKTRWIDSIEPAGVSHATCITVDAPDSLYLANDFIVTHNTALVSWIILWAMTTRPHIAGVVTANTQSQLKSKTWRELKVWADRSINSHWFRWTATRFFHVDHQETWGFDAIPWTEHNSEAFAGLHSKYVCVIFDEASAIADKIWEVTEGAMTTPRAMWFAFGNPTKNVGRFRECFGKYRHRWQTAQIDSRTCRMTNKSKIEEWLNDHGEDSDFFRVRVRGEFPRYGTNQLVSSEAVHEARHCNLDIDEYTYFSITIGVDVARFGQDETVICVRQGRKVLKQHVHRGLNNIQVGARVAAIYRDHGSRGAILVDGVGLGAGVVDYLTTSGYPCIEVNAGARADEDKRYVNKRAEMWHRMAEWLESGADIPDDSLLCEQLVALEYGYDNKERIKLERKEDLKERLPALGSPDRAEALALTFAEITAPMTEAQYFEPEAEPAY